MKKIICTKQCDIDMNVIPIWYNWYTKVFPFDEIIVITVEIPGHTSTEKTIEFYKNKPNVSLYSYQVPIWDDAQIWMIQREVTAKHIPKNEEFVITALDADEFLAPFDVNQYDEEIGALEFVQIRMMTDQHIDIDTIQTANLYIMPETSELLATKGGPKTMYVNTINDHSISIAGHSAGAIKTTHPYFHLHVKGTFDEFAKRSLSYLFESLDGGLGWHVKKYQRELNAEYEKTRLKFEQTVEDAKKETDYNLITEFKNLLNNI